jgi:indolepyruvate ferredoxin oxidoreductase, alpha subunit
VLLLSGDEALALAARDARVALGVGYPGTPSTEILEHLQALGGRAEWAPNEKVAFEVALGVAFGAEAALVTMKHVGLNVAADPFFTAAYSGVDGPLVVAVADDPGMASSQNEQDSRRYAVAAGVPMLEPADSQEAYDFLLAAIEISARWHLPVLVRVTTRVCHCKSLVRPHPPTASPRSPHFERNIQGRVMIPLHAKPAHYRLRHKLAEIAAWNETCQLNRVIPGGRSLGIVTSGVAFMHAREAAPEATVLKLAVTHPLPFGEIRRFAESVDRCIVIEENDPYLFEQIRAAGIAVEQKPEMYRFGELNVGRVTRILTGDTSPEAVPPPGKAPTLCPGCPHRITFGVLKKLNCIVTGDIGCYTLGALPPLEAMDSQLCMGASIGMGLGLRHVLPEDECRRVVSVIGDSTFFHSGLPGLVEMAYNRPATGHVVMVLDNGTTAMTGLQEHPGSGRKLGGQPAGRVMIEDVVRGLGIDAVVVDPVAEPDRLEPELHAALQSDKLTVFVVRRPCLLAAARLARQQKLLQQPTSGAGQGSASQVPRSTPALSQTAALDVVIAGLGGQGVLTASDILAEAAVLSGLDVKKADVHGMSQRGGSVASDVRMGRAVLSPMVPRGKADVLLVIAEDQVENNRWRLREGGTLITPDAIKDVALPNRRSANVALLGVLSRRLDLDPAAWTAAIHKHIKPELLETNLQAFDLGRQAAT